MNIKSPAFDDSKLIPRLYTCDGENINPPLIISDVPQNALSLALIVDDPDAPSRTFTHWLVWNIPSNITNIEENNFPEGSIQGLNGRGVEGYTGPCPPNGTHRYFFKLFALSRKLDLSQDISKQELEKEIETALVEKCELVGLYSRGS